MFENQSMNPLNLSSAETNTPLQSNWVEPELRQMILPLDVDMRRFLAVARVEEEPVRTEAQYRRHMAMMNLRGNPCKRTTGPFLSV
jgi:hypothetical protein